MRAKKIHSLYYLLRSHGKHFCIMPVCVPMYVLCMFTICAIENCELGSDCEEIEQSALLRILWAT